MEYSFGHPMLTSMAATSFSLDDKHMSWALTVQAHQNTVKHKSSPAASDGALSNLGLCHDQVVMRTQNRAVDSHEPGHGQRSVGVGCSLEGDKKKKKGSQLSSL